MLKACKEVLYVCTTETMQVITFLLGITQNLPYIGVDVPTSN